MTLAPVLQPVVRRAILDILNDTGGEQSDDTIARMLVGLGHRVDRAMVAVEFAWLARAELVSIEELGPFVMAEITDNGISVSDGIRKVDGVNRHRTGR